MEAFFEQGLRQEILDHAGHFVHQERPDEVNRLILEFLSA
jgi:pimeloyl-ACP methyl ester carboxylesterase